MNSSFPKKISSIALSLFFFSHLIGSNLAAFEPVKTGLAEAIPVQEISEILNQRTEIVRAISSLMSPDYTVLAHLLLICPNCPLVDKKGEVHSIFGWLFKEGNYPSRVLEESHRDWFLDIAADLHLRRGEHIRFKDKTSVVGRILRDSLKQQLLPTAYEAARKGGGPELGFSLAAYSHYVQDFSRRHRNKEGTVFSVEDLVRMALSRDPALYTEWGSHELIGIASVVSRMQRSGRVVSPVWGEADRFLRSQLRLAQRRQQKNSTIPWLHRPSSAAPPPSLRFLDAVDSTAHNLLWILRYLPREEVQEAWVERSVRFIMKGMGRILNDYGRGSTRQFPPDVRSYAAKALSHAYEVLELYRERILEDF